MKQLGNPGEDINADIAALVKDGLWADLLQRALDVVRVTGNEAVHPGQTDTDGPAEVWWSIRVHRHLSGVSGECVVVGIRREGLLGSHGPGNSWSWSWVRNVWTVSASMSRFDWVMLMIS